MGQSEKIKNEIIKNFGFFPPFYEPALEFPGILEDLWRQTKDLFIDNPIPNLFKEKLSALLGRYCSVPYCLVVHSSSLMPLGMTASDVYDLLQMPALTYDEIIEKTKCDGIGFSTEWPLAGSILEECILYCCVALFLNREPERFYKKIQYLLTSENYNYLTKLITYNKTCLDWAEAHPEISYHQDERYKKHFEALIAGDPAISSFFENYFPKMSGYLKRPIFLLAQENKRLLEREAQLRRDAEKARLELKNLIMQTPIPICLMEGSELTLTLINQPFEKILNLDSEILGTAIRQLFHESDVDGFFEQIETVLKTGKEFYGKAIPFNLKDKLGQKNLFLMDVNYRAFRGSDGQIKGVLCFFQDLTAQIQASEKLAASERHFKALANSIPQIVFVLNKVGQIVYVNQRATDFTGLPKTEITTEKWLKTIHPEDQEQVMQEFETAIQTKTEFQAEYRFRRRDGQYRWYLCRALPVSEPNTELEFFGTITDVDAYKRLTEELETARLTAENSNQTKSAFLANMSHEIRTPLGAILGFTELMKDPQLESGDRSNYLDIISRNVKVLTHIIDDILDLSKVEAGKIIIEKVIFDPRAIFDEVIHLFSETVRFKKIDLKIIYDSKIPQQIISDPARVRQILTNIVGNAVKFTDQGGVTIHVGSEDLLQEEVKFKISVIDTGPGFPESQTKKLFQPFVQIDSSTTRKFGGTGLGLVLSRKMARAIDGDVQIVTCGVNKGCHFLITFSAKRATAKKITQVTPPKPQNQKNMNLLLGLRVLVVEDSKDNQTLIHKVLSKRGAAVDFASDGEEGVAMALSNFYHVVLMDIQMPKLDGYGATRKLREAGYQQPIIALTAHAMEEERIKTKAAGCDGHITKPLDTALLISTVLNFRN